MKFSEAWLREWVNPAVNTQTLGEQLSMAGLEVATIEPVAAAFTRVVVGQIQGLTAHPDADKLRVCQVHVGANEPLQIVCGAANVTAGMLVPVALIGAVLPGELEIKRARLRGVESQGMICSAAELGVEEKSAGIWSLPMDAPIGQDVRSYLDLNDHAITVELTPDRGDCLSVAGIAREVSAINRMALTPIVINPVPAQIQTRWPVQVNTPSACPRYACRILRDINPQAVTPFWMQERLRRSGLRSISPVVDVTNYVMLELGQPLHAFDLAQLDGTITVRLATAGETLHLLDGRTITLRPDSLLIADAHKPLALAGIMGGEFSGVGPQTRAILLESAFFSPLAISGRPRAYALNTDSAYRFERGVDPQLQLRALERATNLLIAMVGGHPGPLVEVVADEYLPTPRPITLRRARIERVLGVAIPDIEVIDILTRLEMRLESIAEGWRVLAPSARFDISIEVDLIEELGRIYGYARIPTHHTVVTTALRNLPEATFDLERAKDRLVDRGYQEVITYSFVSPEIQALVDPMTPPIALANPLSRDLSMMRTSLWPGLLLTARYNKTRQRNRVRIFESGLRFMQSVDGLIQEPLLAGLIMGDTLPEQWGSTPRLADFFDIKSDVEDLLALVSLNNIECLTATHSALHPGQCAQWVCGAETIGWLGLLHPDVQRALDLPAAVFLFELRLDTLKQGQLPHFRPLSKFPSIRRDLALTVDRKITCRQLMDSVYAGASELLQDVTLFDVYTGDNIISGRKSLALGLLLQHPAHTLTDAEVDVALAALIQRLHTDTGATLRD